MSNSESAASNFDTPWKEALHQFLRPFLAHCFPQVEERIDWAREPEFLEQELRELVPDSDLGPQRVDQLAKVWRRDGEVQWLLLHIEVQADRDPDLPQRLFHYHTRLTEKHGWRVVTLCLLADTAAHFRPESFQWELMGCSHQFIFPTCKLLDFSEAELSASSNPIAFVIRAHLAAKRTSLEEPLRYDIKLRLLKELTQHGFMRETIVTLLRLIDWLIRLKATSALELRREIVQYYQSNNMPYVTSFERIAKEEGIEEGLEKGLERGLERGRLDGQRILTLKAVESRFGGWPEAFSERLALVTDEALLGEVFSLVLQAGSLEELESGLDALGI